MIVRQDDLRAEELYEKFKEGLKLAVKEQESLIRFLYRKADASRVENEDGELRVGTTEAADLWRACQNIIRRAERFGLMGLHFNKQQAEIHPLADESGLLFMEFINSFQGPESEFSSGLLKYVRNSLNTEKKRVVDARDCESELPNSIECNQVSKYEPRMDELRSSVWEEVAKLSREQRAVIKLWLDNVPVSVIARNRDVTPQSVYEIIGRAFSNLKKTLEPLWEELQVIYFLRRLNQP